MQQLLYNPVLKEPMTRRSLLGAGSAFALSRLARFAAAGVPKVRLAVTTDEIDEDPAVAIEFLRRYGLRHCEIRRLWDKYNTSLPMAKIKRARSMLDDAGIQLAILDTSFFKVPLPALGSPDGTKALGKQWDLLNRAFERAEVLGTRLIRTFAFTHRADESPSESAYPQIYELVKESADRAHAAGFQLAVENVANSYVATASQSAALLEAVQSPGLGLTWDPNNSARAGDPEPFPAGYGKLDSSRIWHVHLRDYRHLDDGTMEWCGVGDGEFDHAGQITSLLRDGYEGVFSLETHYRLNGSKHAASEHSLKGLLKTVQQL